MKIFSYKINSVVNDETNIQTPSIPDKHKNIWMESVHTVLEKFDREPPDAPAMAGNVTPRSSPRFSGFFSKFSIYQFLCLLTSDLKISLRLDASDFISCEFGADSAI